jgi:hypothetical protein
VMTPSAAAMRYAVLRIASSRLGAALVLASPAPSMRDAVWCAAGLSSLDAAFVLAAPAPAMCHAVLCVAFSPLDAALVVTPYAATVPDAVGRAASLCRPLGAALPLTRPPAHGPPPASLNGGAAENKLLCGAPITAVTHPPLSPHRSTSAHRTPCTRR